MDKTTLLAEQSFAVRMKRKSQTLWMLYIAVEYISWKSHIQYHRQNR